MKKNPLVSVVIPTRNRADLVVRAVESALAQSYRELEVVVVIDGPDPTTQASLKQVRSDRVRIIQNVVSEGGAQARNTGVANAYGMWIAFLDDDDEWLPEKIAKQMAVLLQSSAAHPVGACRLVARRDGGDAIWPYRQPREGEPMSEYLLCRKSLSYGEGIIQTSSIVASKALLTKVPFQRNLPRHHDWDWVLRALAVEGVKIEWVWEPLVIFNLESGRGSVNRRTSWAESFQWAMENSFLTKRAFTYFAAIQIAPRLSLLRDYRKLPELFQALARKGALELRPIVYGSLFALIPTRVLKAVSQSMILSPKLAAPFALSERPTR
jgi:glycosyltransferase involved in cell wall biosynthesis